MTGLLLAAAAFASALDVSAVRTPYARIRIPLAVDPGPRATYPDLRVRDEHGRDVPYVTVPDGDPAALVAAASGSATVPGDAPSTQVATIAGPTNLEVSAVRFTTSTPSFARNVTIEASDDGTTWSRVADERIERFRDETVNLQVAASNRRARWWRATIDNRDDAPLVNLRFSLLVRPKEIIFAVVRPHRYQLTFGDPNAGAPSYDLEDRLRHERVDADRGSAGPIVAPDTRRHGAAAPPPPAASGPRAAAVPGWLTSLAFTGTILVLAAFGLRLARASPKAAASQSD